MVHSPRYCIHCGERLDAAERCNGPECRGLPNFYRDVPGPRTWLSASRAGGGPATESARPTAPVAAGKRGSIGAESRAPRQTLPLPLAPAAVLRGITDPRLVLPIYPGAHEVGAAAPADLILDRPEISSRHARIECRPGEAGAWVIELRDHGSTNGTFVNGERVRERRLQSGDRVRFATLEFELQAAAGRSPRSTAVIEP